MDIDLTTEPLGQDQNGEDVFLRDIWPTLAEIQDAITASVHGEMFRSTYGDVFAGDENWRSLDDARGELFAWDDASTYVKRPPYFDGMAREPGRVEDVVGRAAS